MKDQYPEEYEALKEILETTPPSAILGLLSQAAEEIGIVETEKSFQDYSEQINDAEWEESEADDDEGIDED